MKSTFVALILLIVCMTPLRAADGKYPVSDIPDSLKNGMYAVIRDYDLYVDILAVDKVSIRERRVTTILNEKAKQQALEVVNYDKNIKVNFFRGVVYDANGKEIKRLKPGEIYDRSAIDGGTLFDDNRQKIADLSQTTYPYTVEYESEIVINFLLFVPEFVLFSDDEISIQKTSYSVAYPSSLAPRFKLINIKTPNKSKAGDKEFLNWSFTNVRPQKFETYSSYLSLPRIMAAPSQFKYDSYSGNMSSWKEFGKWSTALNIGRDELPEITKKKIKDLTKDLSTTEQKTKALYEYLQSKTRYVGIQLGIGGYQPFPAKVVDEVGYGDCKALSNYMVAMLKEANIKGYYTLIRAGRNERELVKDFASSQFNHAVVFVPNGADTLWLECTSQTAPFGYAGSFTGDRFALAITEDGGKIVRTPVYTSDQNKQTRTAEVMIDDLGNGKAKVKTTYRGIQYENDGLNFHLGNQSEDQKKWVQNTTHIPTFNINSYSIKDTREKIPSATVKIDLDLPRYASVSGKRMFISPNLMNKYNSIPAKIEKRMTEVVTSSNWSDVDTIVFNFPKNLYPEFLPTPAKIASRFGEYETNYTFDEGKLIYIRKMKVWSGTFPKEAYNEMVDFYKNVSKSDNTKIVFLNKT